MKNNTGSATFKWLAFSAALLAASAGLSATTQIYLRAGTTTMTMADGRQVLMWGFAQDSGAFVQDGTISVPGPAIALGPGAQTLAVHLKNTLTEPVSLVIPSQWTSQGDPVRNPDGRVRSFTHEAPPGGTADYLWENVRPGTFLYHSGTHPSLQVQMGLYGALTKLSGFGESYPGVSFEREITLLMSEIDPDLHDAVAADEYGPGKTVTSTLKYSPQYFLIDGVSYTNGMMPVFAGSPGDHIQLRLINAGLDYRIPTLNGGYFSLVAEDGNLLPFPRETYAVTLPPLKTMDALFTADQPAVVAGPQTLAAPVEGQTFALYDRRLGLVNSTSMDIGGMLTHLDVSTPGFPTDVSPEWIAMYFGPGPAYPPNTVGPFDDPDQDGVNNLNESIAGTNPNDPLSYLHITALSPPDPMAGAVITFGDTAAGRQYTLESTTNLASGAWTTVQANVPGFANVMWLTDPSPMTPNRFYRIRILTP